MTSKSRASVLVAILALGCLALYGGTAYFGIRSPDAEVVFRTARSLAEEGDFSIQADGPPLQAFGTARGRDGKSYSVFGPLQPLMAVPFVLLASKVPVGSERFGGISHYVDDGLSAFTGGFPPALPSEHQLRSLTAVLNLIVSTLAVLAFFLLTLRLTCSGLASMLASILFGFGTLVWPYSGTFFSEPLSMLFLTLSLLWVTETGARDWKPLLSGVSLGLSVTAHLSAILFVPFLGGYVVLRKRPVQFRAALTWATGVGLPLILLAWHNYARFGSVLETGRGVGDWHYADWVAPGAGLYGLLLSWGKGLLWFSPAAVLGLMHYRRLSRRFPLFATMLLGALVFRLVFLACRSDWHGGFGIGPRYLLLALPILLLPMGFVFQNQLAEGRLKSFVATAAIAVLCVVQQLYFALGEIFSFLHMAKLDVMLTRQAEHALYLERVYSPLFQLLQGRAGPLHLQTYDGGLQVLWTYLAALLALGVGVLFVLAWKLRGAPLSSHEASRAASGGAAMGL